MRTLTGASRPTPTPNKRRHAHTATGLAAALIVTISACSSGTPQTANASTPSPAPATTSATQTPTPTIAPTPTPTSAKEQVLATIREYFDAANYAIQTGDTTRLKAITRPLCPCYALVRQVESDAKAGRRVLGGKFTASSMTVSSLSPTLAGVTATVTLSPYQVLEKSGEVVGSYPAHTGINYYGLVYGEGHWWLSQARELDDR